MLFLIHIITYIYINGVRGLVEGDPKYMEKTDINNITKYFHHNFLYHLEKIINCINIIIYIELGGIILLNNKIINIIIYHQDNNTNNKLFISFYHTILVVLDKL